MKQLKIFVGSILFILSATRLSAQNKIRFTEIGYLQALEQSRMLQKPLCFMCYATWCTHCNKMKQHVFTDSTVADYYNTHFVCVAQDMEKGEGVALHKEFKIKSYPSFIFFDSSGTILFRTAGEFLPADFIQEGANALDPKKNLSYLQQQFEKNVTASEKTYEYLRVLNKADLDYSAMLQKYFATQTEQQLLSEVNWRIIANGVHDIHSTEFQFVLRHQKEYSDLASPERVNKKIVYTYKELLNPLADANDTVAYALRRSEAAAIHHPSVDSLIFTYDIQLAEKNNHWDSYKKITLQHVEAYVWNNYALLKSISGNYLKQISDKPSLQKAIEWAQRSLALQEEYDTYILCARLFMKIFDIHSAIQMAQKGKDLAIKYGWGHAEADQLISSLAKSPKGKKDPER